MYIDFPKSKKYCSLPNAVHKDPPFFSLMFIKHFDMFLTLSFDPLFGFYFLFFSSF